jgi:hypothetical protein
MPFCRPWAASQDLICVPKLDRAGIILDKFSAKVIGDEIDGIEHGKNRVFLRRPQPRHRSAQEHRGLFIA